jgi:chromosome segregation ATPase
MVKEEPVESLLPNYSERSRSGPPRPEPVIDPERVALENNVRVADAALCQLEKERVTARDAYDVAENEYEESKLGEMKEKLFLKVELDRLKKKNHVTHERVRTLGEDMRDSGASLEYATLIVAPPEDKRDKEKARNYVLKLQKQVIEAVENMQAAPKKLANLVDNFDEAVTKLRTQLMNIMEERSRTEVQLRKQIGMLQDEIDEMGDRYKERIQDSEEKLAMLRAKWDKKQTFEDLEEELEEADSKLEELQQVHAQQEKVLNKLETTKRNSTTSTS